MQHKHVAVVIAMRRELAPLLRERAGQRVDGIEFIELENAVVAVGGIGRVAAWGAAKAVVARYKPSTLISAGVVGALSATLKVGDVVRGREVIDADSGARFTAVGGDSVIVTVSSVSGPAEKRSLAARYKADVVDMESSAVAAVAREHGVDFLAVKAVSDELDFAMPPVGRFVDADGSFATARFAAYIAMRPKWWSVVRQLALNSKLASLNLSHEVEHLMEVLENTKEMENVPRT